MSFNFDSNQVCTCGKLHKTQAEHCVIASGALEQLPEYARKLGASKAFLVADANTYPLAGDRIIRLLGQSGISASSYIYQKKPLKPDEWAMGSLCLHFDNACDLIIGIGSGVINDICKLYAYHAKIPYIIVATAAYMDGYAAGTSSMSVDRIKTTIAAKSPDVIIGDTAILSGAPAHMAMAGLGDMLAKYVSICEWRLSHLINGEYYCPKVAQFTRESLRACVESLDGLRCGNEQSVEKLFTGLINSGKAMDYAGVSRPGGGVEHYFCQIWDMRGLAFGTPTASHGVQCALGTLYAIRCYHLLKHIVPSRDKALTYVNHFDFSDWSRQLTEFVGEGAKGMIALEAKEQKYCRQKHAHRLKIILENWEQILQIIEEELPPADAFEALLERAGLPRSIEQIGMDPSILPMTLKATKDIRDKYVLPRLLWDLGILDEICDQVFC